MTASDESVPASYFQALYDSDPDPWRFASSPYERDKYATTLAAIGESTIAAAWEVGCSIGVFTTALAARCTALLAVDVADAALERARRRCAHQPWVTFQRLWVPREWPDTRFDLMVFSEVLYFLSASDIRLTARRALSSLTNDGRIILVNWTGETGHSVSGDKAADLFHDAITPDLAAVRRDRHTDYRLDVYQRSATSR